MEEQIKELLEFFKALADANRLKIIGLLAQDEYPVEQIAEMLGLRPRQSPTIYPSCRKQAWSVRARELL